MSRSALREELYQGILDDAAQSCHYWYHDHMADSGNLPKVEFDDWSLDHVARGWRLLHAIETAGGFHCCGDDMVVRRIESDIRSGEDPDIPDACVSDAVIQLGLFGKMIYG